MKKFLINIAIFFAIVAAVDFSLGYVFHCLQARAGGRTGAEYYACKKSSEDVIIMGSSRASHHYVSKIITEKTGMSCFNAGQDGNGIIMQYGRWLMISERYIPKFIIYDVSHDFDLNVNDNMTYIDRLKPFCNDEEVKDYISRIFPIEKYKTLSKMYSYNYKFIEMAFDYLRNDDYRAAAGYLPLNGHIKQEVVERKQRAKNNTLNADEVKLYYLEQLVKEAKEKGTKVVFVVSPYWKGGYYALTAYDKVKDLANSYDAPFVEYLNSKLCEEADCFEDSYHLNDKGARMFTENIVSYLRQ